METKEELVKALREWVKMDNDIRVLEKEVKKRRMQKKTISESLMHVMKQNEIDCFDINDGQILYKTTKTKKPITKASLLKTLSKYFNGNTVRAEEVNEFILENREEVVRESIHRVIYTPTTKGGGDKSASTTALASMTASAQSSAVAQHFNISSADASLLNITR